MNQEFDIYNARISILDDQPVNVALLERLLKETGYRQLSSTMSPQTVCDLHEINNCDLILFDLKMPAMDGFAVIEGLKKSPHDTYPPVIKLTAKPAHKLRALQAGAKEFISKPFDLIEVKIRIYSMLKACMLYQKLENYSKLLEYATRQKEDALSPVELSSGS